MTTPNVEESIQNDEQPEKDERKRRTLLLLLLLLLLALCCVGYFIVRYLIKPQPVTQMLPVVQNIHYAPTYQFSVTGVAGPVGVAVSPDNQYFYVSEGAGDRLLKKFDRAGNLVTSFAPPGTNKSTRSFAYMAVNASGQVYVVDRHNNVIDIFDADGKFIDAILGQDLTLSKLLSVQFPSGVPAGTDLLYDGVNNKLNYVELGKKTQTMDVPKSNFDWAPLGIRFDAQGNLIYTDVSPNYHSVHIIPAASLTSLSTFNPKISYFGTEGKEPGQFSFPNTAVVDSRGNFYISDGNNYRLSEFSVDRTYKTFFGFGNVRSGVNLPRGLWIDQKELLHVADAIGNTIRVYDVSGAEPVYAYAFGSEGTDAGEFSNPTDICIDSTGRVYIADRSNGRIQIWSY